MHCRRGGMLVLPDVICREMPAESADPLHPADLRIERSTHSRKRNLLVRSVGPFVVLADGEPAPAVQERHAMRPVDVKRLADQQSPGNAVTRGVPQAAVV